MATFYLDFEGGNDANDGTTFANRWKTIQAGATAARIAPGDTIRVMASPDPTDTGINATFTNDSNNITLASALTLLVTDCDSAWTAATNVTATVQTGTYASPTGCAQLAIASGFTTGKVAHFQITTTDFSAYQGITFWFKADVVPADGTFEVKLCSDTAGVTAVDTFAITGIKTAGVWEAVYINKGSALGASIQSVAIYATVDPGTTTIQIDNINATKAPGADCLHLKCLIGKSGGADGGWYPIRWIEGTTVHIDAAGSKGTGSSTAKGFYGTTETVACWIRVPISVDVTNSNISQTVMDSGTAGSLITFSGGWNRTDMSTQTGDTYVSNDTETQTFMIMANYIRVDKIHPVRWGAGFSSNGGINNEIGTCYPTACVNAFNFISGGNNWTIETLRLNGCAGGLTNVVTRGMVVQSMEIYNHGYTNIGFSGAPIYFGDQTSINLNTRIGTYKIRGCATYGWSWTQGCEIKNLEIDTVDVQYCGVSTAPWAVFVDMGMNNYRIGTIDSRNNYQNMYWGGGYGVIQSVTLATPVGPNTWTVGDAAGGSNPHFGEHRVLASSGMGSGPSAPATWMPTDGWLYMQNYNGVAGDHRGWYEAGNGGKLQYESSNARWKLDCLQADYNSDFPIRIPIAQHVILKASEAATIKLSVNRTNTLLTARMKVRGDEVGGIAETIATASGPAGSWEVLSFTVTPTEIDELEIWLEVFGGSTHSCYFKDFSIT